MYACATGSGLPCMVFAPWRPDGAFSPAPGGVARAEAWTPREDDRAILGHGATLLEAMRQVWAWLAKCPSPEPCPEALRPSCWCPTRSRRIRRRDHARFFPFSPAAFTV